MAFQWAAPCMKGAEGRVRSPARDRAPATMASSEPVDAQRGGQEVALAPQRALGHAGGAAGVDDVAVVGERARRAGPAWRRRAPPRRARPRAAAAHPSRPPPGAAGHAGQVGEHLGQGGGERPVEDHGPGGAVGQDVAQLGGHVAVVDVDRGGPGLPGAEHALQVLVAVVQVEGHVVVRGLPRRPGRRVAPQPQPRSGQHRGQAPGAVGDLGPGRGGCRRPRCTRARARPRRWPRAARRRCGRPARARVDGSLTRSRGVAALEQQALDRRGPGGRARRTARSRPGPCPGRWAR